MSKCLDEMTDQEIIDMFIECFESILNKDKLDISL